MNQLQPRDLIGYADRPPRVEWPHSARLALNIAVNYEEGSEENILLGDETRDRSAEVLYPAADEDRELIQESMFEFGSRVGHWRIIEALDEYECTCSVFASAMALEMNPEITAAYLARGYDFVGHGYRWLAHYGMTPDEERLDIRMAMDTLDRMTGKRVTGWFGRPLPTPLTRTLLAEEGIMYDSTAVNDELPYYQLVAGRPMLIVPYALDTNDVRLWRGVVVTAGAFFEYLRDAFDVLYRESGRIPRMMSVGLHGRSIGRAGRILALHRFLEYVRRFNDVWIAQRSEIASVWAEQFAPPHAWNWDGN